MKHKNMHEKLVASMQAIALDSINKAKGGHIGMAIGLLLLLQCYLLNF